MARRGATLELAVMGLLHDTPMHGYELRKELISLLGLGRVLLATGEPAAARAEFEAVLARAKDERRAINGLGVAFDLEGNHGRAQEAYRRGLAVAADDPSLAGNMALSLALSGQPAEAEVLLASALARRPNDPALRQNLALVLGLAGDDARAATVARQDVDEAGVRNNLAFYARLRGITPYARAQAIFRQQLDPDLVRGP